MYTLYISPEYQRSTFKRFQSSCHGIIVALFIVIVAILAETLASRLSESTKSVSFAIRTRWHKVAVEGGQGGELANCNRRAQNGRLLINALGYGN